jgi:predicted nucleic acid-binding protein
MTSSSSLANNASPLIIDTSVLINLHASQQGERILGAIPNEIIVPQPVVGELDHQTSKINGESHFINTLISAGKVQQTELSEKEFELFEQMVAGSTSLGDGEAASIALAVNRNLVAVIDDRKGRNHAQNLMVSMHLGWSIDLFLHPIVKSELGEDEAAEAIYSALRKGRMRIHEDHCDQVVNVIGVQRALACTSLPNYKGRRALWEAQMGSPNSP